MSSTVAPEVVLAGRYRLVRRLAGGGMGQVWRANDEILSRPVAIKLLRSEYAEDPEFIDRFRAEARRTAALSHPGIASVFDYGETGDADGDTTAYLVMELVEGEPLSVLLAREGRLSPAHTLDVLAQSALALDSAHQAGVVHRDVKPSNLLLRRDGVVKVTDFGIAHAADEAPRTEAGLVVGTAAYLSPEQVACRPATPASDVYALGVVAYECLAGRRPFTGDHPIALALAHRRSEPPPLPDDVPETVRELVSWMMSKAPKARPPSAGALGRQALATRSTLPEGPASDDPQTPTGGWLPVMSGWHPALGRGREPDDGQLPIAGGATGNVPLEENGDGQASPPGSERPPDQPPRPWHRRSWGGSGESELPPEWNGADAEQTQPEDVRHPAGRRRHPFRRRRGFVVTAVVVVTALMVGGITAAARQRSQAVVPSVAGQRITAAGPALARAGFEVRELSRPDATVRAGVVISQAPAAGTHLARGRTVTIVMSTGPRIVVLDPSRYLGRSLDTVRAALIRLRLRVSVVGRAARARLGTVIAINPSGALHQGDNVTVTVTASLPRSAAAADAPNTAADRERSGEKANRKGKDGGGGEDRRHSG
ncbi:MAG TPA: protein kinase [Actinomycetota bacterium]|jgi:serine/threonine-protein kinase|nr:protein kinase [Actinomycetota bacterium]